MTITNDANRLRLKNRPGIILEFDPPRWDYEEATDTIGRVYTENGLTIYKLPGDIPDDTNLETIEPVTINRDGTVQQWFYTRTSDPEAETTENHNRKLAEELEREAEAAYHTSKPAVPVRKYHKFDLSLWNKLVGPIILALVIFCIGTGIAQLINTPKQVTVRVTVKLDATFKYTLSATQSEQQITPLSLPFSIEAEGDANGSVQVPDVPARGNVRLFNPDLTPAYLPAGTVIATVNNVNYKLVQNVSIPAANLSAGKFGVADVQLQADKPGPEANIPGGLGSYALRNGLRVSGLGAITGGTSRTLKVVTPEDVERVKAKLQAQASQETTASFDQQLNPDQKRWGEVTLDQPEFSNLPEPGSEQPSGKFKSKLTVQLRANSYNPQALITLAVAKYQAVSDGLPVEYGIPRRESLTSDVNGNYTLIYIRSVQTGILVKQLTTWQGSRAEFELLLDKLRTKPGLSALKVGGELPQELTGQLVATFQYS